VCDLETSRIGAPYIHDISNLRVKQVNFGLQILKDEFSYLEKEICERQGFNLSSPMCKYTKLLKILKMKQQFFE